MKVGIPTEVKNHEDRVAITPSGVREFASIGHSVVIQSGAGRGSGISDEAYLAAGAAVVVDAGEVWQSADLVLKVKEPTEAEFNHLRPGLVLFTYLHLAANRALTEELMKNAVSAVAYESVTAPNGSLPLLVPMSEIAGRLAPQVGAQFMMNCAGGGRLISGAVGVSPARVVVIGAGVAGSNAAMIAHGLGGDVTLIDRNMDRLRQVDSQFNGAIRTAAANQEEIESACIQADLVIGAVLVSGARAPWVVRDDTVSRMREGSVLVDISIDQGGCFEGSVPTTHAAPTYRVHDSTFYCVTNMPGAVPRTSTYALTNVTLAPALALATKGLFRAIKDDEGLGNGLNTHAGHVTNAQVAIAHDLPWTPVANVRDAAA